MGLADKLNGLTEASQRNKALCSVGQLLSDLALEDREALGQALASSASTRSIYDALRTENYKLDRQSITLHRKGYCRCEEKIDE